MSDSDYDFNEFEVDSPRTGSHHIATEQQEASSEEETDKIITEKVNFNVIDVHNVQESPDATHAVKPPEDPCDQRNSVSRNEGGIEEGSTPEEHKSQPGTADEATPRKFAASPTGRPASGATVPVDGPSPAAQRPEHAAPVDVISQIDVERRPVQQGSVGAEDDETMPTLLPTSETGKEMDIIQPEETDSHSVVMSHPEPVRTTSTHEDNTVIPRDVSSSSPVPNDEKDPLPLQAQVERSRPSTIAQVPIVNAEPDALPTQRPHGESAALGDERAVEHDEEDEEYEDDLENIHSSESENEDHPSVSKSIDALFERDLEVAHTANATSNESSDSVVPLIPPLELRTLSNDPTSLEAHAAEEYDTTSSSDEQDGQDEASSSNVAPVVKQKGKNAEENATQVKSVKRSTTAQQKSGASTKEQSREKQTDAEMQALKVKLAGEKTENDRLKAQLLQMKRDLQKQKSEFEKKLKTAHEVDTPEKASNPVEKVTNPVIPAESLSEKGKDKQVIGFQEISQMRKKELRQHQVEANRQQRIALKNRRESKKQKQEQREREEKQRKEPPAPVKDEGSVESVLAVAAEPSQEHVHWQGAPKDTALSIQNPTAIKIDHLSANKVKIRWNNPNSRSKLHYKVLLSVDQGREFKTLIVTQYKFVKLLDLRPNTKYFLSVVVSTDAPNVKVQKKRTVVHFTTRPDAEERSENQPTVVPPLQSTLPPLSKSVVKRISEMESDALQPRPPNDKHAARTLFHDQEDSALFHRSKHSKKYLAPLKSSPAPQLSHTPRRIKILEKSADESLVPLYALLEGTPKKATLPRIASTA